jgi:guanylate kinase
VDLTSISTGLAGKGLLFVVSSVSGGGKTTVIRGLMDVLGDLKMSVSHTTRKPRPGELDGRDYHYIPEDRFTKMISKGEFLEWAEVYGHYYGTSSGVVNSIAAKGDDAVLDIDVQGAMQVKAKRGDAILIFIVPPGEREQASRRELAFIHEYHYSVLNKDLDDAIDAVRSIVRAERCRERNVILNGGNTGNEA